ncbi:hypothetical protein C1X84_01710 [Pseudomonas sp. GP01-A1]|nr:hypothetical protein C1X84_01710 [Pseudomonas sp. GP01-A1]
MRAVPQMWMALRSSAAHAVSVGGGVWGRACSRMRWFSQYISRLIRRFREQARSHTISLPQVIFSVFGGTARREPGTGRTTTGATA